jgi:hypothetical protein
VLTKNLCNFRLIIYFKIYQIYLISILEINLRFINNSKKIKAINLLLGKSIKKHRKIIIIVIFLKNLINKIKIKKTK